MSSSNPMIEYLYKLQLIISNTEFKNKYEASKYETVESKLNGDKYVRAVNKTDTFESYQYDGHIVYDLLAKDGMDEKHIFAYMDNPHMLPIKYKNILLDNARNQFIKNYKEPNKYYKCLSGMPFEGNNKTPKDEIVLIPDEFYAKYADNNALMKSQPIHEMPYKYQELFINSEFYKSTINKYPDATYLKFIGSNRIPIEVSRKSRDGDIMRINTNKLSGYHPTLGNVSVSSDIVHAYCNIYKKTRDYIYQTLRGDFSSIYPNYDSFIHFLTIYMSIGNALNEFQNKSTKLIYMNNVTANNLFTLYGLPSVIMEGKPMIEFLKKFRLLLMDKGTNIVYRVKDLIGYSDTDIYTLVMVKQQVFEDGIPIYYYNEDGTKVPKQNIFFRRLGTTDDNTSYFKFKSNKKEYTVDEITSGDPRWWNTPEVDQMLQDMNYTLSNSKYIQLSTHMSMTDIWWQCVILIRGILDKRQETNTSLLDINYNINGKSTMSVFEATLILVILMNWHMNDYYGNYFKGEMYKPNNFDYGKALCIDMLFNGLYNDIETLPDDWGVPKPLIPGLPYKISSFNFEIRETNPDFYKSIESFDYINPDVFLPMLENVLDRKTSNVGETLMTDAKLIYKYLEEKLRTSVTIQQFRQVTDVFSHLFLVDPIRKWYDDKPIDIDKILMKEYQISEYELYTLKSFFLEKKIATEPDMMIKYNKISYKIYLNEIMNNDVWDININDSYPFRDNNFVNLFCNEIMNFRSMEFENISGSQTLKTKYQYIIKDKVTLDLSDSINGPSSFEQLLFRENSSLYKYLLNIKQSNPENLIIMMRSIIKALENYTDSKLSGLECKVLGIEQYMRILKEVITYFKSYMVEFTKEEFVYIFDGLFDNGGNSNMLRLYDEITSGNIQITPHDSNTLYDVSKADVLFNMDDRDSIYDDALFRLKTSYKNLIDSEYEIWYDDGKQITNIPFDISDNSQVIANIISIKNNDATSYKIIINKNNVS